MASTNQQILLINLKRYLNFSKTYEETVKLIKNDGIVNNRSVDLNHEDIYERLKKYEFNKTEPETLRELVKSALKKGDIVKTRMRKFKRLIDNVKTSFERENLIHEVYISNDEISEYNSGCAIGIDGSFQCVGGVAGIWYVPTSCAIIIFEEGIKSQPVAYVTAGIEDINENEHHNVQGEASIRMLDVETRAINECASKLDRNKRNVIFIDGPIADPPFFSESKYVKRRCDAILRCIEKNALVIGCVKRPFGKPYISYVNNNILKDETERERLNQFISDVHLVNYIFTKSYFEGKKGVLMTTPAEISNEDEVHQSYLKNGVRIFSVFMQKDPVSRPIRLDIPQKIDFSESKPLVEEAVKTVIAWSYPGYNVPLPVILAHNKCTIRKGCAEVLYEEIITRAASPDPFDSIIKIKMG